MPFIVLMVALGASLVLTRLLLLPLDWLTALSLPTWLYLTGALALLSWCLGD